MKKKILIPALAVLALLCCLAGGSLAWLTARTQTIENVFTVGNIDIALAETKTDFKMIPGCDIAKDPVVTVRAGSEKCYLFVEVTKSANFDAFLTYEPADGWTALPDHEGVYYRVVDAGSADQAFPVLAANKVSVKGTVTKDMLDKIADDTDPEPTLSFTAYAVQFANGQGSFTPADAWAQAKPAAP